MLVIRANVGHFPCDALHIVKCQLLSPQHISANGDNSAVKSNMKERHPCLQHPVPRMYHHHFNSPRIIFDSFVNLPKIHTKRIGLVLFIAITNYTTTI